LISKSGSNVSLAREEKIFGGQGVRRETESEGLEENCRVVINGSYPVMNRSAKDEQWLSPHYGGESVLVPAHRTKVFASDTAKKINV
jgi:hypothetical protein